MGYLTFIVVILSIYRGSIFIRLPSFLFCRKDLAMLKRETAFLWYKIGTTSQKILFGKSGIGFCKSVL